MRARAATAGLVRPQVVGQARASTVPGNYSRAYIHPVTTPITLLAVRACKMHAFAAPRFTELFYVHALHTKTCVCCIRAVASTEKTAGVSTAPSDSTHRSLSKHLASAVRPETYSRPRAKPAVFPAKWASTRPVQAKRCATYVAQVGMRGAQDW